MVAYTKPLAPFGAPKLEKLGLSAAPVTRLL